jgi:hypothetical protein
MGKAELIAAFMIGAGLAICIISLIEYKNTGDVKWLVML